MEAALVQVDTQALGRTGFFEDADGGYKRTSIEVHPFDVDSLQSLFVERFVFGEDPFPNGFGSKIDQFSGIKTQIIAEYTIGVSWHGGQGRYQRGVAALGAEHA